MGHDDECPPGCTQRHAFHYVRVRASRSTAPAVRRAGRRLDLVVDLQEELRWVGGWGGRLRVCASADAQLLLLFPAACLPCWLLGWLRSHFFLPLSSCVPEQAARAGAPAAPGGRWLAGRVGAAGAASGGRGWACAAGRGCRGCTRAREGSSWAAASRQRMAHEAGQPAGCNSCSADVQAPAYHHGPQPPAAPVKMRHQDSRVCFTERKKGGM